MNVLFLNTINMKKALFAVVVFALGIFVPFVAMADTSNPTTTNVYFESNGEPYEGSVDYTVNCYGYTEWPGDEWFGVGLEEGTYTPEVVYSYSASCPEYGCEIQEDYYMNYRHIDYCDLEGTTNGVSFSISDFGDIPYTGSCSYEGEYEEDRICDTYFEIPADVISDMTDYPFSDVSYTDTNYDAITYLYENGFVEGYSDGTYKPDNTINRAEFLKIVFEVLMTRDHADMDVTCDAENGMLFSDVSDDEWYSGYVCKAVYYDIVEGYPDGSFKPGQEINFAEAAKMIVLAFGYDLPLLYDDVAMEWYDTYLYVLEQKNAVPESIDSPADFITRGEMAEIVYLLSNE